LFLLFEIFCTAQEYCSEFLNLISDYFISPQAWEFEIKQKNYGKVLR
jgi:hypothetical protein